MGYFLPLLLGLAATPILAADKPVTVTVPRGDYIRIINRASDAGWSGAMPGQKVTLAPGEGLAITRYSGGAFGLDELDKLDVLHHLDIQHSREKDYAALGRLKNLRSLEGVGPHEALSQLTGLRHLTVEGGTEAAEVLSKASRLPALTSLRLDAKALRNPEVREALSHYRSLQAIDLGVAQDVSGEQLACLAALPKLESLEVWIASGSVEECGLPRGASKSRHFSTALPPILPCDD